MPTLKFLGFPHTDIYQSAACTLWKKGESRELAPELASEILADHGAAFEVVGATKAKKVNKTEAKTEEVKTATVDRSIKRKAKK